MLEVTDLHSYYGDAHVLQGVSLNVERGEIVALLGRNGMGKTTTIRSIMNLRQPLVRQGEIRFHGERLNDLPTHAIAKRRIALVPQGRRLFASLTVVEHLTRLKPAWAKHGWTVERVLDTFPRLAERRRHRGNQLSGGERQMVSIGTALMSHPQLLILDEPTLGLAPKISALALADRIYLIETGRIVHHGTAAELQADPSSLQRYLGVH